jgi:hypothetical protein
VKEIYKDSGILANADALAKIRQQAVTHAGVARNLMCTVFTEEALRKCSLMGKPAKGPLGKPAECRPGLYRPAVDAVISKCNLLWYIITCYANNFVVVAPYGSSFAQKVLQRMWLTALESMPI